MFSSVCLTFCLLWPTKSSFFQQVLNHISLKIVFQPPMILQNSFVDCEINCIYKCVFSCINRGRSVLGFWGLRALCGH